MRAHPLSCRVLSLVVAAGLLAACSASDDNPSSVEGESTSRPAATSPETEPGSTGAGTASTSAATTAPPAAATTIPGATTAPAGTSPTTAPSASPAPAVVGDPVVASEVVASVDTPINLGVRPGDEALYVLEQGGRVLRITAGGEPQPVADISDRVDAGGERGLLGIAYSSDGARAWLHYSGQGDVAVISEFPVAGDGTFDVDAERVLLTLDDPYPNHNGGDLLFGSDGMLWIAMGDGGSGGDPERRASDTSSLFGKILRIDPNQSGDAPYGIPADNPFGNEVWSFGLRNPWKLAVDPVTGELWIADVGQNQYEEIDVVSPTAEAPAGRGVNFGWSGFEGNEPYNDDVDDPGDTVFPVYVYDHSQGCSISGGAVYRGTAIAELAPAYVYSDFCSGTLWAYDAAGQRNLELGSFDSVSAVRTGPDGELYVLESTGNVIKLTQG